MAPAPHPGGLTKRCGYMRNPPGLAGKWYCTREWHHEGPCTALPPPPDAVGTAPGNGRPDWPEDLTTYAERKAYQRGIANERTAKNIHVDAMEVLISMDTASLQIVIAGLRAAATGLTNARARTVIRSLAAEYTAQLAEVTAAIEILTRR